MRDLKKRAYAGILSYVLVIPLIYIEFLRASEKLGDNFLPFYYVLNVVLIILSIYFWWGFNIIGAKMNNKLLSISTIIMIILLVIFGTIELVTMKSSELVKGIVSIGAIVLMGIMSIPLGIGLLRLKKDFGAIATSAGVLNIITGIALASVILIIVAILLYIPMGVLELILMFKASNKLKM
ncbi:MAG: helix-turn-helix protein [archaeon GW2011_AR3]|nr:MAG: helix-turn-helix protein [archaeon GW2011_AR3]MBS3109594.1 hypothetical protein [Candidatus Woesearchaeota archaeon]